jgi:hypothetical protein
VNQNNANAVRSNHPLGEVVTPISTYLQGTYGLDAAGNTVYEPREIHKGDAARSLLYMSLRYNGVSGFNWTFNNLNNVILLGLSEDPQDLATLLTWHATDAPDSYEIARNDYIQSKQQNRNPFIDHPDWVSYINFNTLTYQTPSQQTMMPGVQKSLVTTKNSTDVRVWPNPSESSANLTIDSATEDVVSLSVYDLTGKLIYTVQSPVLTGSTTIPLEVGSLTSGFYVVQIVSESLREEVKFRKL